MIRTFNSKEWFVWEQNASPMLLIMTLNPSFRELREYLGSSLFTTFVVFEPDSAGNYQGKWVFRFEEGRQLGQKMVDMLLCPPYRVEFNTGIEASEGILLKKSREIQFSLDLERLGDNQLVDLFEDYCQTYYNFYKYGTFVEPVQWRTEEVLTSYFEEKISDKDELAVCLRAVFTTEEDIFIVEILHHLMSCAKALGNLLNQAPELEKSITKLLGKPDFADAAADLILEYVRKRNDDVGGLLRSKLQEHSESYYWKKNNYYSTSFISPKDVLVEILSAEDLDINVPDAYYAKELAKIRESKVELLDKKAQLLTDLPAYYHNVVGLANTVGASLADKRKKLVLTANAAFDRIMNELANRTKTPTERIRLLIPQELRYFVSSPSDYHQRFTERERSFLVYHSDFALVDELLVGIGSQGEADEVISWKVKPMMDPFIAEGDEVEKVLDRVDSRLNLFTDVGRASDQLQGVTAYYDSSEPEVIGTVKVIRKPQTERLTVGEILVAPSTTPDYIDAIQKCRAIITDWGGQTSHAAITSRELKKPCIIGTNFASQVLRSGDMVRIDFLHGTINTVSKVEGG